MIANLKTQEILATDFAKEHTHDFQLFKDSRCGLTLSIRALADAGYQGLAAWHANSQTPFKKTKRHPLTQEKNAAIGRFHGAAFLSKTLFGD